MVEQIKRSPYPRTPVGPLRPTDPVSRFDYLYDKTNAEKKRRAKKIELRERFRALMSMSDTELTIFNANQRYLERKAFGIVYSPDDHVFQDIAKQPERQKFENRTLTREEYHEFRRRPHIVNLQVMKAELDMDALMRYTVGHLARAATDPRSNGHNGNAPQFIKYVLALLKGETFSRERIETDGLDPKEVKKEAQVCVSGYKLNR